MNRPGWSNESTATGVRGKTLTARSVLGERRVQLSTRDHGAACARSLRRCHEARVEHRESLRRRLAQTLPAAPSPPAARASRQRDRARARRSCGDSCWLGRRSTLGSDRVSSARRCSSSDRSLAIVPPRYSFWLARKPLCASPGCDAAIAASRRRVPASSRSNPTGGETGSSGTRLSRAGVVRQSRPCRYAA